MNNNHQAAKVNEQADDIEEIAENDTRSTTTDIKFMGPVRPHRTLL